MVHVNPTLLVITLSVNGFNTPIKRQRLEEWLKNSDPITYCLQEAHFIFHNTRIS